MVKISNRVSRAVPPALSGLLALFRLLPAVSPALTALLALVVLVMGALPLAFAVVSGLLVGSIPAAVHGGLDSAAGHHALLLLGLAAATVAGLRLLAPVSGALAASFGRLVDLHLQERVMAAVVRPTGIGHLEDPEVLNLVESAQGIGSQGYRPGDAVPSLAGDRLAAALAGGAVLPAARVHPRGRGCRG